MCGRVIVAVEVNHPRTVRHNASPAEVVTRLTGRRISGVGRRGKYLVVELDEGFTMIAHLGMSGRFKVARGGDEEVGHTHLVARLDDGSEIRFIDPRTFGFVAALDEDEVGVSGLAGLGPDAWTETPTAEAMVATLAGRTAPIKALLLDQGPMAGLGNIYADEVLHRARIHPLTRGGDLTADRVETLLGAVRSVLEEAITRGGTTLDDLSYLLPDGRAGENLDRLAVYGRQGQPCRRCGAPIERILIRQRSTHFCRICQAP